MLLLLLERAHEDSVTFASVFSTFFELETTVLRDPDAQIILAPLRAIYSLFSRPRGPRSQNKTNPLGFVLLLAGPRGLEPRPTVLETVILPLNYRPFCFFCDAYTSLTGLGMQLTCPPRTGQ